MGAAFPPPGREPAPLQIIVTDGLTCPNCGAPEVQNPDAPVAEWRFNIRAHRVVDEAGSWSDCRACGQWFVS